MRHILPLLALVLPSVLPAQHAHEVACRAAGSENEGGSIQPVVVLGCLTELARIAFGSCMIIRGHPWSTE
jgi:hypothetical protein